MPISIPLVALTLVMATSFGLLVLGRRYLRAYVQRHGKAPPAMWMFRRAEDPAMEQDRRLALVLLPIFLLAAVIYLARPGG